MGTFIGHAVPGSFFFLFAVWWTIKQSYRIIMATPNVNRRNEDILPRGKWAKKIGCYGRRTAEFWEGIVIIAMWIIGILIELPPTEPLSFPYRKWEMFDPVDPNHPFVWGNKWQHITMYSFFGIWGTSLVLANTHLPGLRDYQHFIGALAYFVEGLLFYFHVHGRTMLDITIHYLLVITIALNTVVKTAEQWKGDSPLLPFLTAGFTMVQGTWFWQAAFMLYPPAGATWDEDDHANVMFATMAYCWHIAAALFIMSGTYGIVSLYLRWKGTYSIRYNKVDNDIEDESAIALVDQTDDQL
ncbi:transmembrane protein 45B-like [Saccoglossus kowalevskii]